MYYSSIILSAVVLFSSEVGSLRQCGDCVVYTSCSAAHGIALHKRDQESENLFRKAYCGDDTIREKNIPKVCCSDFSPPVDEIETHPNRQLLPDNCGDCQYNRIYGGTDARLYELPWMVLISHRTKDGLKFTCGGSLINSRYVLTAAHCVYEIIIEGVRLGELDLKADYDCQGSPPTCEKYRDRLVSKSIIHERYNQSRTEDDIALLRLKNPFVFTFRHIRPICLPVSKKLREIDIYNKYATVAGWGATEHGTSSSKLLKARVLIRTPAECIESKYRFSSYNDNQENETTLCAGGSGTDSCSGDSGGPLIMSVTNDGSSKCAQYGIVSKGAFKCGTSMLGIYTNVSKYMKWILDNIKP